MRHAVELNPEKLETCESLQPPLMDGRNTTQKNDDLGKVDTQQNLGSGLTAPHCRELWFHYSKVRIRRRVGDA